LQPGHQVDDLLPLPRVTEGLSVGYQTGARNHDFVHDLETILLQTGAGLRHVDDRVGVLRWLGLGRPEGEVDDRLRILPLGPPWGYDLWFEPTEPPCIRGEGHQVLRCDVEILRRDPDSLVSLPSFFEE